MATQVITNQLFRVHVTVADWSAAGVTQHGAMYNTLCAWIDHVRDALGAQRDLPTPNSHRVQRDGQEIIFEFGGYGDTGEGILKIAYGSADGPNHVEMEQRIQYVRAGGGQQQGGGQQPQASQGTSNSAAAQGPASDPPPPTPR